MPPTPRIKLDNGEVVWGFECWWGAEVHVKAHLNSLAEAGVEIVEVLPSAWRAGREGERTAITAAAGSRQVDEAAVFEVAQGRRLRRLAGEPYVQARGAHEVLAGARALVWVYGRWRAARVVRVARTRALVALETRKGRRERWFTCTAVWVLSTEPPAALLGLAHNPAFVAAVEAAAGLQGTLEGLARTPERPARAARRGARA